MLSVASPAVRLKSRGHLGHLGHLGLLAPLGRAQSSSLPRLLHTTASRPGSPTAPQLPLASPPSEPKTPPQDAAGTSAAPAAAAPLSVLPLTTVLRSYFVTAISSSKILLPPSLALTSWIANSTGPLLNPDRNPLLHYVLKKTFYAQFCAGETPDETRRTIASLKNLGLSGVILGYAKEVVLEESETGGLAAGQSDAATKREVTSWAEGTLETVRIAAPGDFVALKFTGAGREALFHLAERKPPAPILADAIDSICQLAASRGVRLLFDAEQFALQAGIDDWTMTSMRRYNTGDHATIYGTYQAYLKSTPATLSRHLRAARDGNFALGVKLVRGAYIGSDPRHLIHDTKAETDAAYDGIAEAVLRQKWLAPLDKDANDAFPRASIVVASHNATSVCKARAIVDSGAVKIDVAFGQLQGMADEVTCTLLGGSKKADPVAEHARVKAYKYLVWGSTGECMKYLLRRAHENRDAVQRTRDGRNAMRAELWRRLKTVFGV